MAKEPYRREYALFSLCGLNCGLCPNFHSAGRSRCSGCGGAAFFNPGCAIVKCAVRHGVEYCFFCAEYPCARYEGADETDSFITHRNQLKDNAKAKRIGIDAYRAELEEKTAVLQRLLERYNDGRRKNLFCLAVNLLELEDVKRAARRIAEQTKQDDPPKAKAETAARLLREMAERRGVELELRKKAPKG